MENSTLDKTIETIDSTELEETIQNEEFKANMAEVFKNENTSETPNIEAASESVEIKTEDANTTNCLALTIQEDHKLIAIKNVFLRSIRMSWKVVVSTVTLALIKLLS